MKLSRKAKAVTSYEQYVEVSNYIKTKWVETPVFILDEPIGIAPPYIVVRGYGVSNTTIGCSNIREDQRGYDILAYNIHRGKTEKMLSDLLDRFNNTKTPSGLDLCNVEQTGQTARLEEGIYEGMLSFKVKSHRVT